ncbi:MAG: pilus assembly protein [Alphaproteobacteria bacterium]|nr:pilus assembly protein [Alphaproteobacteria bacterium]
MSIAGSIATKLARARTICKRLRRDQRGSVAVFLGIALVPLVAAIGIGVDSARGYLVRSRLSQSLDSAALAGGRVMFESYRDSDVQMYFTSNFPQGYLGATVTTPTITPDANNENLTVTATATLPATFMQIFGKSTITVQASTTINRTNRGMELALVLDNTGSMSGSGKMTALKTAATDLLNILYGASHDTANNLYVSVVPFVAMVNIGEQYATWTTAKPNPNVSITSLTRSSSAAGGGGTSSNPTTYTACATTSGAHGFQDGILVDVAGASPSVYNGRVQIHTTSFPSGCTSGTSKFWYVIDNGTGSAPTTPATGTITVRRPPEAFAAGSGYTQTNGKWKGCVEARTVDDGASAEAAPSTTAFYKAFWPSTYPLKWYDGTKRLRATCSGASSNNSDNNSCDNDWVLGSAIDEDGGSLDVGSYGPNKGCPVAVTPLQPSKATAIAAINGMTPWYGGGTSIPAGLSWGWRVLSPNYTGLWAAPSLATLPGPYNQALIDKVIVLLSDGMNEVVDHGAPGCSESNTTDTSYYAGSYPCSPQESDYTAYGRLTDGRMGGTTITAATTGLNSKITSLCNAMKASDKNIIIYTIILQVNDATIQNVFQNCATKPEYFFVSPSASDLGGIFKKIANQLSNLRLSR